MFRVPALLLAAALSPGLAGADTVSLETRLHEYVEAFDLAGLPPTVLDRLRVVAMHPQASHAAKVFELHDILQSHGALRHVDMHGDGPSLQARLQP